MDFPSLNFHSLETVLKKVKHRMVESMSSSTADALGLSRAILCNGNKRDKNCHLIIRFSSFSVDHLIKKMEELDRTANLYRELIKHTRSLLKCIFYLARVHGSFGYAFADIGAHEPQIKASEAFTKFGDVHRQADRHATVLLQTVKPVSKGIQIQTLDHVEHFR